MITLTKNLSYEFIQQSAGSTDIGKIKIIFDKTKFPEIKDYIKIAQNCVDLTRYLETSLSGSWKIVLATKNEYNPKTWSGALYSGGPDYYNVEEIYKEFDGFVGKQLCHLEFKFYLKDKDNPNKKLYFVGKDKQHGFSLPYNDTWYGPLALLSPCHQFPGDKTKKLFTLERSGEIPFSLEKDNPTLLFEGPLPYLPGINARPGSLQTAQQYDNNLIFPYNITLPKPTNGKYIKPASREDQMPYEFLHQNCYLEINLTVGAKKYSVDDINLDVFLNPEGSSSYPQHFTSQIPPLFPNIVLGFKDNDSHNWDQLTLETKSFNLLEVKGNEIGDVSQFVYPECNTALSDQENKRRFQRMQFTLSEANLLRSESYGYYLRQPLDSLYHFDPISQTGSYDNSYVEELIKGNKITLTLTDADRQRFLGQLRQTVPWRGNTSNNFTLTGNLGTVIPNKSMFYKDFDSYNQNCLQIKSNGPTANNSNSRYIYSGNKNELNIPVKNVFPEIDPDSKTEPEIESSLELFSIPVEGSSASVSNPITVELKQMLPEGYSLGGTEEVEKKGTGRPFTFKCNLKAHENVAKIVMAIFQKDDKKRVETMNVADVIDERSFNDIFADYGVYQQTLYEDKSLYNVLSYKQFTSTDKKKKFDVPDQVESSVWDPLWKEGTGSGSKSVQLGENDLYTSEKEQYPYSIDKIVEDQNSLTDQTITWTVDKKNLYLQGANKTATAEGDTFIISVPKEQQAAYAEKLSSLAVKATSNFVVGIYVQYYSRYGYTAGMGSNHPMKNTDYKMLASQDFNVSVPRDTYSFTLNSFLALDTRSRQNFTLNNGEIANSNISDEFKWKVVYRDTSTHWTKFVLPNETSETKNSKAYPTYYTNFSNLQFEFNTVSDTKDPPNITAPPFGSLKEAQFVLKVNSASSAFRWTNTKSLTASLTYENKKYITQKINFETMFEDYFICSQIFTKIKRLQKSETQVISSAEYSFLKEKLTPIKTVSIEDMFVVSRSGYEIKNNELINTALLPFLSTNYIAFKLQSEIGPVLNSKGGSELMAISLAEGCQINIADNSFEPDANSLHLINYIPLKPDTDKDFVTWQVHHVYDQTDPAEKDKYKTNNTLTIPFIRRCGITDKFIDTSKNYPSENNGASVAAPSTFQNYLELENIPIPIQKAKEEQGKFEFNTISLMGMMNENGENKTAYYFIEKDQVLSEPKKSETMLPSTSIFDIGFTTSASWVPVSGEKGVAPNYSVSLVLCYGQFHTGVPLKFTLTWGDAISQYKTNFTISNELPIFDWNKNSFNFNIPVTFNGVPLANYVVESDIVQYKGRYALPWAGLVRQGKWYRVPTTFYIKPIWQYKIYADGTADCWFQGNFPLTEEVLSVGFQPAPIYLNDGNIELPLVFSPCCCALASVQWNYSGWVQAQAYTSESDSSVTIRRFCSGNERFSNGEFKTDGMPLWNGGVDHPRISIYVHGSIIGKSKSYISVKGQGKEKDYGLYWATDAEHYMESNQIGGQEKTSTWQKVPSEEK